VEYRPEIATIKSRIQRIENVFAGQIKVLYRLSDFGKDVFLITKDGRKMKLRILPLTGEELIRISQLSRIEDRRVAKVVEYRIAAEEIYLITTFFPGKTLYDTVREEGVFSEKAALNITREIALILKELHGQKPLPLIFRDLQPKNIVIRDHEVYLIDIERIKEYIPQRTHDTQVMGTVGFIAPEQYGFGQADEKSDIYSLGMCLYFMVSGRIPEFRNQRVDFRNLNLSDSLQKLLLRMTDFSPEKRLASVERVIDLIENRHLKRLSKWVGLTGVLLVAVMLIAGSNPVGYLGGGPRDWEAVSPIGAYFPRGVTFNEAENIPYHREGDIIVRDFSGEDVLSEYNTLIDSSTLTEGPFEFFEVGYNLEKNHISLLFSLGLKNATSDWNFALKKEQHYDLLSFEDKHPMGNYRFILTLETETVKNWVKDDPEGDDFFLEIDGFIQPVPLRRIFLRHGAELSDHRVPVWVETYDYYFKEVIESFSMSSRQRRITTETRYLSDFFPEWQPVEFTIEAEGYLENSLRLVPSQFKWFSLPMVRPREGILQGFIVDTVDHGGLIGIRVYLEEVAEGGKIYTLSRRDLYFEEIAFYSFSIDSEKNYIIRYEILEKPLEFLDEGYVTGNGVTPHLIQAWVINENQAMKRTVNINLLEKQ